MSAENGWTTVDDVPVVVGDFITWREIGQEVMGRYEGSVDRVGRFGDETVLTFTDARGTPFNLNGSYDLKSKLTDVPVGSLVAIKFRENVDMGPDKNPMRKFLVRWKPCPQNWPRRAGAAQQNLGAPGAAPAAQPQTPPAQRGNAQAIVNAAPAADPNAPVDLPF